MSECQFDYNYEIEQIPYCSKIKEKLKYYFKNTSPKAFVKTYGCQQNVSDSEKYKAMLLQMGFDLADDKEHADLILFNTCAIRENAENKVFGNIGWIKNLKKDKPDLFLILCGCMTEQENVAQKIKDVYPFVDLVFGTHSINKFPEILYNTLSSKKPKNKTCFIKESADIVPENLPVYRGKKLKAFVSIMYGCNNFCSYCIVPYVRGRERSRKPESIVKEFKNLLDAGYKDITLLGQNVNSYGKGLEEKVDFPDLLKMLDGFDGEYKIRFMTSHPKDATKKLFDAIASSKHVSHHIHLPVQCGSSRILKLMNRKYTANEYLEKVNYAKSKIPDLVLTSDIIVGFPGETYEEFRETINLIREVKFASLFTFIYSPREGTPAAKMPDSVSKEEKTKWILELIESQKEVSSQICETMVGKEMRVLVEDFNPKTQNLICRTDGNMIVEVDCGTNLTGEFTNVIITGHRNESLIGKIKEN